MNRHAELADQAATSLISADLALIRDLVRSPHLEPIRAIAILALNPFLSAFIFDSAKYLKQKDLEIDRMLQPHQELLRTSRQRFKLLDDSQKSFAEILKSADDLVAINNHWFSTMYSGELEPSKRPVQPDLGVYFLHDEMFCTTHVAFLNLGLTEEALAASSLSLDTLGPYLRDTAVDLGRYVASALSSLNLHVPTFELEPEPELPLIGFRDLESDRFYGAMAPRVAPHRQSISILLTSILSQVNTVRILVPMIAGRNELAAFKLRFLGLFHAAANLQRLLDQSQSDAFLHPSTVQLITTLLDASPVKSVRANRNLRNTLAHYRTGKHAATRLFSDLPLFGLVEALSPGETLSSMTRDVGVALDLVAHRLRGLLPQTLTPEGTL